MFKDSDELTQLLAEIESGDIIDHEQPLTSIAEMEKRLENALVFDEEFLGSLEDKFKELVSNPENIKKMIFDGLDSFKDAIRIRNNDNLEFEQLLKLFTDIDSVSSGKAVNLIVSVGILGSNREILDGCSFVQELEGLTGERLVRKIIEIAPTLIEGCYKRYLSFLVLAKYALSNSKKQPDPKLGVMIQQASSLGTDYPLLINNDIGWLRNSVAHHNWRYDVESGAVFMWDDKHPEVSFLPEEIMSNLIGTYLTSSKVFFDACHYYKACCLANAAEKS
jgi:hypothetical protein